MFKGALIVCVVLGVAFLLCLICIVIHIIYTKKGEKCEFTLGTKVFYTILVGGVLIAMSIVTYKYAVMEDIMGEKEEVPRTGVIWHMSSSSKEK